MTTNHHRVRTLAAAAVPVVLFATACGSSGSDAASAAEASRSASVPAAQATTSPSAGPAATAAPVRLTQDQLNAALLPVSAFGTGWTKDAPDSSDGSGDSASPSSSDGSSDDGSSFSCDALNNGPNAPELDAEADFTSPGDNPMTQVSVNDELSELPSADLATRDLSAMKTAVDGCPTAAFTGIGSTQVSVPVSIVTAQLDALDKAVAAAPPN